MAITTNKLTAKRVETLTKPGLHGDGDGLYLQVTATKTRSWVFRFKIDGAVKTMGLGPYPAVSLADARQKAGECRRLRADGGDPLALKRDKARQAKLDAARAKTFKECADQYIETHKAAWRNAKTAYIWGQTFKTYANPVFGDNPVSEVVTAHVVEVLKPIWSVKPETAGRVRRQIEAVLNWAKAQGFRSGENPAAWRGHLDHVLPRHSKVAIVQHHAALPYKEVAAFLGELCKQPGLSAVALRLLILTATRTSEVLQATWDEVDLGAAVWTIPAARMKAARAHRVPLSKAAIDVFKEALPFRRPGQGPDYVFPGNRAKRPLSNMVFLMLLRRMEREDLTAHGFRSSFRDWAAETTHFPNHVVEMALAHTIGSAVEAAYRRGDLFEKRCQLMEAWAGYCCGKARAPKRAKARQAPTL